MSPSDDVSGEDSNVVFDETLPEMSVKKLPSLNIPGPKNKTPFGRWINLFKFMGKPVEHHLALAATSAKAGNHFVSPTQAGDAAIVIGVSREAMEDLCVGEADHWRRPAFGPFKLQAGTKQEAASSSLSTTNGEEWKQRRDVVKSGISPKVMVEAFSKKMHENMQDHLEYLHESHGEPVSMLDLSRDICLKNVATVFYGIDNIPEHVNTKMSNFLKLVVHPMTVALQHDVWPLPYHTLCENLRMLYAWAEQLVVDKRNAPDDSVASMMANKRDAEGNLTPVEKVVGDLIVLYITGKDGPAAAVAWTLFLLATHPFIQDLLSEEVSSLGVSGPFLDAVCNESMRVLPGTFFMNPRLCQVDGVYAGVHIPRGAMAIGSILARHHDPEVWRNPRVFDPSRWISPGFKKPNAFDFMPFGQGPRRCVGAGFATAELKEAIAGIVKEFRVDVVDGKKYNYVARALVIEPHKKNMLTFTSRKTMGKHVPKNYPLGNIRHILDY